MNDILNINGGVTYDDSVTKIEYHSYSPYLNSYNNSDEIRISIQQQDLYLLPSKSFIYIEGNIRRTENNVASTTAVLTNNSMAYLFDDIRYELNGVEVDRIKNAGYTTTMKNYISASEDTSKMLHNAGWSPTQTEVPLGGNFNYCMPLSSLLGFAEDYKHIMMNARHELILTRTRGDDNATISAVDAITVNITKLQWRMPHVNVADKEKLSLLKILNSGRPLQMSFRSWDIYEYPVLPTTSQHNWTVKTANQLEKPRYVVFALQTGRKNTRPGDVSKFDHCELSDFKLHLNSQTFPYDDMNINFGTDHYALLYHMYSKFQESYYGCIPKPLLSWAEFKSDAPLIVIDCSRQNEMLKSGPVDVRIEFKTRNNVPANTSAYCLLLHDRIVEYNPLTNEVKKLV